MITMVSVGSSMRAFLKTHRIAIFLTIVVGIITGLPTILAPLALGSGYHGIPFLPLSDEYHYFARIQEILDGHWSNASTFLYEYKNMPTTMYAVNETLYAIPALILGIIPIVIASKFVLPAVLFFLSYLLLFRMFRKDDGGELTAIAAALFVVLGAEFVNYSYLMRIPTLWLFQESQWTRLVNPIVGAVQLTGFLILLWQGGDRKWRYAYIAAGVLLASMVGYIFTFALSLAILGALFVFALARREYDIAKKFFFVGCISTILDSLWWYVMLTTLGGEAGRLIATQSGMAFTHAPVLNKAVLAASVLFALFFCYTYFYLKDRGRIREWFFAASLLVGSWIAFNQQIITGREVWYPHFVQYTVPLCVLALISAGHLALHRHKLLWQVSMYALCVITLGYGILSVSSYASLGDMQYFAQNQSPAGYSPWLNMNAKKDCVVLVNVNDEYLEYEERLIPTFSHCNTYTVNDPVLAMTEERNEHNFLLQLQMRDIDIAHVRDYLVADQVDVRGHFYSDFSQAFGKGMEPWIVNRIDALTADYKAFVQVPLETNIKKYRADYLLSDGPLQEHLRRALPNLTLATTTQGYYLYTFPEAR